MLPRKNQALALTKQAFTFEKSLEIASMLSFVAALLLLGLSLLGVSMRKTYYYLPPKELKRQAEAGDKLARALWRAVAYDTSLRVLLWLWIGLSAAGGFVLLAKVAPWGISLIATALLLWIAFAWFPRRTRLTGLEARLGKWLTPVVVWLLNYLHPIFDKTAGVGMHRYPTAQHTNLYESEDLLEVVRHQKSQPDNRILPQQLEAVERVLTAHQYKLADVLTPRAEVKTISDTDTIGLVLIDELHKSGQTIFPVVKSGTDKIVGALYLDDLNLKTEGSVRDYMQHDVRYLHEDDSLQQALHAFFKTRHQLFVVVNSFEEYLGIITLEHVVKQLTGEAHDDNFDQHHDMAAVANKHAHDDDEPKVEDVELEPDEVAVPESDDEATGEQEDPDFTEVTELDGPADVGIPETEVVTTNEAEEPDADEPADDDAAEEPVDPDALAALDLPDEDDHETFTEGSHVTFKKDKKPKAE
ncbi:MAG TPA: CBS domain-containing protein [Candidatus Saccharimonadales bacterium]|nr:CBS domain-containing protein [Candidatus Saccharimonadales bacterium]